MRIGLTCDHAGRDVCQALSARLQGDGHEAVYLGPATADSVDYPDYARDLALRVAAGEFERGIAICGTGIGVAITANKVRGIRAAVVHDDFTARMAREHNDANVLCLGARVLNDDVVVMHELATTFLASQFEGGRHERRVNKINALDEQRR